MRAVLSLLFSLLLLQQGLVSSQTCSNASGLVTAGVDMFIAFGGAGITVTGGTSTSYLTNGLIGSYPTVTAVCGAQAGAVCAGTTADQLGNSLSQVWSRYILSH
jgi:hypothetical protein